MPKFLLEATSLDLAGNQKKFLEILLWVAFLPILVHLLTLFMPLLSLIPANIYLYKVSNRTVEKGLKYVLI